MSATSQFKISNARLDEKAATPLYQQIYDLLKKQILSGHVSQNSHLPSEQEITQELGVSRITARRALNELAASGLVKRQRGRGTVVTFNASAPTVKASFENLIEGLTRIGVETEVQLIDCRIIKAPQKLAEIMELKSGQSVQKIIRQRMMDGEPFSYLITHIPENIASGYDSKLLASESLIKLLDMAGHRPCAATQTITAISADADIAKALGVSVAMPVLCIHRLMRDENEKIVQEITAHYRADRFQYQMNLARQGTANWTADE